MSYVIAAPDMLAAAAADVAGIGSSLSEANTVAAASTTRVIAAAGDEVSTALASLFAGHGQAFQAFGAQAAAFHSQFVQALTAAGGAYTAAEAANASALQTLEQDVLGAINAPFLALSGRPLIGNGAGGATGITQAANMLATDIFGSPPSAPIPATQGAIFTGTPSLATRIEVAGLWGVNDVSGFFGIDLGTQLGPSSPLSSLVFSNTPPLSLFIGNTPPKFLPLLLGETVQQTTYDGMGVVQITPAHPSGHYVVAIHGGSFIFPPSIFHWLDYTLMANQTGATIEVPIYPLVQQGGTAGTVVPEMAGLISMEIAQHGAPNVSVTGDSAGGNLALAAVEYMVNQGDPVPASMVLLSPWLDVAFTNPNIAFVHDPLSALLSGLTVDGQPPGKVWAGNLPENNYLVSPLYGSLKGLPPTYVYSGSLDPVGPDVVVLQQEAATQGAPISFVLGTGELHDWVLLSPDGFKYLPQIYQELGI